MTHYVQNQTTGRVVSVDTLAIDPCDIVEDAESWDEIFADECDTCPIDGFARVYPEIASIEEIEQEWLEAKIEEARGEGASEASHRIYAAGFETVLRILLKAKGQHPGKNAFAALLDLIDPTREQNGQYADELIAKWEVEWLVHHAIA